MGFAKRWPQIANFNHRSPHVIHPQNPHHSDDAELIRRVAEGQSSAFTALYDRHSTLLYSVALKILANPEEAEDVVQHVFQTLFLKAGTFSPAFGTVEAWLATIARNQSITRIRRQKRYMAYAESVRLLPDSCEMSPRAEPAVYSDEVQLLRKAVSALPDAQRLTLELAYFSGLTQMEIADKLAQPLGTVKARIRRGLIRLHEELKPSIGSRTKEAREMPTQEEKPKMPLESRIRSMGRKIKGAVFPPADARAALAPC